MIYQHDIRIEVRFAMERRRRGPTLITITKTWTWDRLTPDEPAPSPEPRPETVEPLPLDHPRALQRLVTLLFDHFRTQPAIHRELNLLMKHWREHCDTGIRPYAR